MKNKIVVLSDIHIGTNAPTVWYQKSLHESYLVSVLDWVKSNAESIQELILLGDVVDFWTYPADQIPPSFDAIMGANPNIFGPNGKLSQVLTALNGKVSYVRGNHDMSLTQADLDKIQNPNAYKIKLCPDDIYYPLGNANRRIACTHGHIYAMFNKPYNKNNAIAPLPLGFYITRAVASMRYQEYQQGKFGSVAELQDSGDPDGIFSLALGNFLKDLIVKNDPSLARALLTGVAKKTEMGENQPIKLTNGQETTFAAAKQCYENLWTEWIQEEGGGEDGKLVAIKSAFADYNGSFMGWFTQRLAFQVGADLVVMGHTHTPISGLSDSLIQYVNAGFNCPSVPDIGKKHPTFVTINVDNLHTDVMQVFKEGNSYSIKPGDAQRDSVAERDFSCYVIIDNQEGKSELRRKDFKAEHGHYIVSPPEIIKPGETVRVWLQDYPGNFGAEGWVKYVKQDNQQEITFKYGCPFTFLSSNYCSGANFSTKSGSSNWGTLNEVTTSGHPFFVKFDLSSPVSPPVSPPEKGNLLHISGTTSDGKLWHSIRFPSGSWSSFGDVEGQTGDRGFITNVALQGIGDVIHLCAVNNSGSLWHTLRHTDGSWSPFGDVEVPAGDRGKFINVSCAEVRGELHLSGVTNDGHLWHTIRHTDGSWSPFGDVEVPAGDRGKFINVSCAEVGGELHVCGVTDDGHLWHTIRHTDGSWSPFGDVEGPAGDRGYFKAVSLAGLFIP